MPYEPLGSEGRASVVGICLTVVVCAIFVVTCFVKKGCPIYDWVADRKRRLAAEQGDDRDKLFISKPPHPIYQKQKDPLPPSTRPDITLSYSSSPTPVQFQKYDPLSPQSAPPYLGAQSETSALLGSLQSKRDSTYSSMSENSGRTSPTASMRSSFEGSIGSAPGSQAGSPVGGESQGQVSFSVQYMVTNDEKNLGKLILSIQEARGLPGRQYMGGACDPYVKVVIWRERRSLRRIRSPPLHVFCTRTMRHTTDPNFNQSFVLEVNKSDIRDFVVKLIAMDSDKYASPTTLGETILPLKEVRGLITNPEKIPLNYFLTPPKYDLGEILFGVSYLPTAKRLSVSIVKASHLKYQAVVEELSEFCPFIRVLILSSSGRVLRRKKTTFKTNTDRPVWNENLIFDLVDHQVESVTFLLALCSRTQSSSTQEGKTTPTPTPEPGDEGLKGCPPSPDLSASPYHDRKHVDKYLGKTILGCNVPPGVEREHWVSVLASPRKVISQWQSLK